MVPYSVAPFEAVGVDAPNRISPALSAGVLILARPYEPQGVVMQVEAETRRQGTVGGTRHNTGGFAVQAASFSRREEIDAQLHGVSDSGAAG